MPHGIHIGDYSPPTSPKNGSKIRSCTTVTNDIENLPQDMFKLEFIPTGFNHKEIQRVSENLDIPLETPIAQYLVPYLNFGYYLLLLPFKVRFNSALQMYEIKTNIIQKILHLVAASLVTMYFLLRFRYKIAQFDLNKRDPGAFFDIACYFFDSSALIPIYVSFIFKKKVILEVINQIQTKFQRDNNMTFSYDDGRQDDSTTKSLKKEVSRNFMISCFICTATFSILIFNLLIIYESVIWTGSSVADYFLIEGTQVYGPILSAFNWTPNNTTETEAIARVLSTLAGVINSADGMLNTFADFMFIITILLYRGILKEFVGQLKVAKDGGSSYGAAVKVLKEYQWLKLVTKEINNATGIMTFAFILVNLPFFVTGLLDSFLKAHALSKVKHVFVAVYYFMAIFMAAKVTQDMLDEFKEWIWRNHSYLKISDTHLNLVIQEVSSTDGNCSPFGLRGCNMFTINFTYFSSIIGLVVTYTLIKFQLQISNDGY